MSEVAARHFETLEQDKIPEELEELLDVYYEEYGTSTELKQALVMEAGNALVASNTSDAPPEKKVSAARVILGALKKYFPDNSELREVKLGVMGEVCAQMAFQEMRFGIYHATDDEDLYRGIDFFADPSEGKPILAIQVKTHFELEEPFVELVGPKHVVCPYISEANAATAHETGERMLDYSGTDLARERHPEFGDREIMPVIVRIPGAVDESGERAFRSTGEPSKDFSIQLYDIIEPIIWTEEEF